MRPKTSRLESQFSADNEIFQVAGLSFLDTYFQYCVLD